MKFVQKLGKALMLPVACLPICGILMGLGYAMCPSTMQGGDVTGIVQQIGFFLVKAGGALIDHMALLFAIGVGVGMSDDHDGTAGLAALASWLMITNLLSTGAVSVLRTLEEGSTAFIAFSKIENPFIGIIAGIIGALCYNRFKSTKLPDWLSFFSGKRCVAIVAGVVLLLYLQFCSLYGRYSLQDWLHLEKESKEWELLELVSMHSLTDYLSRSVCTTH